MTLERIEPHTKIADILMKIFRCEICSLMECVAIRSTPSRMAAQHSGHLSD
jgi:hypothetical protein